jgi:tetratricopeptide (TPR) repeat protein
MTRNESMTRRESKDRPRVEETPEPSSTIDPRYANDHVAEGHRLSEKRQFADAETCFRKAIEINPFLPMAHNNLGFMRQAQGDPESAIGCYQTALELDPALGVARGNLAKALVRCERYEEALAFMEQLLATEPADPQVLDLAVGVALDAGRLELAGAYAMRYAIVRGASRWYPHPRSDDPLIVPSPSPEISAAKLRHDIEQLQYLGRKGVLADDFSPTISYYERLLADIIPFGERQRFSLNSRDEREIGGVYGRLVHIRPTPRVLRAVSNLWDPGPVENKYINEPPGIVWIDNFLTKEALENLRAFCLESTIWSINRYTNGYLGSFFRHGFNCPLLHQIAEELRQALPRIIGNRPLLQMWGYKYDATMQGIATHADFAAINVNFWITPDDANLNAESGGLVVYNVEAPLDWDFSTYNNDRYTMMALLRQKGAIGVNIPYRQNRVVIFNSDLFHETAPFEFRSGYENRRINVTMLYGTRAMA